MEVIDLKSTIHKMIDGFENEQLLKAIYDFLKVSESNQPCQLWGSLTAAQKQEVLLAYDESEDESNFIDWKKFLNQEICILTSIASLN